MRTGGSAPDRPGERPSRSPRRDPAATSNSAWHFGANRGTMDHDGHARTGGRGVSRRRRVTRCERDCVWTGPPTFARCGAPSSGDGRIAQLVEQLTLNQRVLGSSPSAPTKIPTKNSDLAKDFGLVASQPKRLGSTARSESSFYAYGVRGTIRRANRLRAVRARRRLIVGRRAEPAHGRPVRHANGTPDLRECHDVASRGEHQGDGVDHPSHSISRRACASSIHPGISTSSTAPSPCRP